MRHLLSLKAKGRSIRRFFAGFGAHSNDAEYIAIFVDRTAAVSAGADGDGGIGALVTVRRSAAFSRRSGGVSSCRNCRRPPTPPRLAGPDDATFFWR